MTGFFNPNVSNQISLIVISVDSKGVAGGGNKRGDWPLIIIVNNSMSIITSEDTHNFPL